MKLFFVALCLMITHDPIRYKQLSWDDFKGQPQNLTSIASTCSGIVVEKDTAYAIFDPYRSWTRTCDPYILAHEQLHFDISQKWATYISMWQKQEWVSMVQWAFGRWEIEEIQYDTETKHGQDTAEQRRWEKSVKAYFYEK